MVEQSDPLKILCFGMGAIGTYVGGSLAATGCKVTFIEQKNHIKADQTISLKIFISSENIDIPEVKMTSDLEKAVSTEQLRRGIIGNKSF